MLWFILYKNYFCCCAESRLQGARVEAGRPNRKSLQPSKQAMMVVRTSVAAGEVVRGG